MSISAPVRQLKQKYQVRVGTFVCLKAHMATPQVIKYFNPSLETELSCWTGCYSYQSKSRWGRVLPEETLKFIWEKFNVVG